MDRIIELLSALQYWHWGVLAIAMFFLESLVSGGFFLGAGGAAVAIRAAVLLAQKVGGAEANWQLQVGVWLVLSLLFTVMSRLVTGGRTDTGARQAASATAPAQPN